MKPEQTDDADTKFRVSIPKPGTPANRILHAAFAFGVNAIQETGRRRGREIMDCEV